MKHGKAPADRPEDAALDALAAALAPRVARILREHAANDSDVALADLLAKAGFELDEEPRSTR